LVRSGRIGFNAVDKAEAIAATASIAENMDGSLLT